MPHQDMPTLASVLDQHDIAEDHPVRAALAEREERQADALRMAGVNFGLHAEIVAEALAEISLGTITPEHRTLVRQQFETLMSRLIQGES